MEEQSRIITLANFDLAIDANLAKTKLDAYGIPCFLTNEASLYPIPVNLGIGGVQLMVFEQDKTKALDILREED